MSGWAIFGLILLALAIGLIAMNLRDLIRYLKIRFM
jgi:hypothetical protein